MRTCHNIITVAALFGLLIFNPIISNAQLKAPKIGLSLDAIVSSTDSTPFWLQSNRYGLYSSTGSQFLTRFQAHSSNNPLTDNLSLSYGADLIARPVAQPTATFNQGYIRLDAWNWFLQTGRFHNRSPIHNEALGMGSLGVSGNASPIPQIRLGLSDWASLPLTEEFAQIKFHVAHGWVGGKRYTKDVLYHEKVIHLRFGGSFPLNPYAGVAHYALWGGSNEPYGDLPSRFSDFIRVFRATGGGDRAPLTEEQYVLGDHRGGWDFGFFLELSAVDVTVYRNFPIESKHNLKLKSPQDALTGIDISFPDPKVLGLSNIVYEYLYTKWQAGPRLGDMEDETAGTPGGNRNYYNNGVYKTGWSYLGRTIGNPLFLPRQDNLGIENSRIVGHHIGILLNQSRITWQLKATYSRNYGTWREAFSPRRDQYSYLIKADAPFKISNSTTIIATTEIAIDRGELVGDQTGVLFGLKFVME